MSVAHFRVGRLLVKFRNRTTSPVAIKELPSLSSLAALLVMLIVFGGRFDLSILPVAKINYSLTDLLKEQFQQIRWWVLIALGGVTFSRLFLAKQRFSFTKNRTLPLLASYSMALSLLVSVGYSSGGLRMVAKALDVVHLVLSLSLIQFWCNQVSVQENCFARWIVRYGIILGGVASIAAFATLDFSERAAIAGGGPNTFVRIVGVTALCALGTRGIPFAVQMLIVLALSALILSTQSRGGAVAFSVSACILILWNRHWGWRLVVTAGISSLAVAIAPFTTIGQHCIEILRRRFYDLTYVNGNTAGRTKIYMDSWNVWNEQFVFGHGLNDWWDRIGTYPHNIILELGCDAGLVAVLCLLTFASLTFVQACRSKTLLRKTLSCIALFYLLAAQFSGDIFDSRGFFVFGVMSFFASPRHPSLRHS